MSSSDCYYSQSKEPKRLGTCSVCWNAFKIQNANGLLHRHGPRDSPCLGTNTLPIETKEICSQTFVKRPIQNTSVENLSSTNESSNINCFHHPITAKPLIKRIPKTARNACASLFRQLLDAATSNPDDILNWSSLLQYGPAILSKPAHGGTKKNLTNIILRRIADWHIGNKCIDNSTTKQKKSATKNPNKYMAASVSSKLEDGNIKAAIRIICSEDTPAPNNAETLAALKAKHPVAPANRREPISPSTSDRFVALQVSSESVRKEIANFPAGSAGGPDGLTPQHIKDMIADVDGHSVVTSLTNFVNMLLKGVTNDEVNKIIFGGRLLALNKKSGGIRPITVGYTLRRLAAKCANSYAVQKLKSFFEPVQLGVASAGGAEAAIHATRRFLASLPEGHVIVKLDFKNAFNTIRRDSMLAAFATEVPELYRFCHAAYSGKQLLQFGEQCMTSEEGVQQGDPIGPLAFCLTIQPLLRRLSSELRIAYLDDITLGGSLDSIESDVAHIQTTGIEYGVELNVVKCEATANNNNTILAAPALAGFSFVNQDELTLLGAPVLGDTALNYCLTKKVDDLKRATKRLQLLESHDALFLLKNCLSIPKMTYILRTSVASDSHQLDTFDKTMKEALSNVINVDLNNFQWLQATLPTRYGGLGIRSAVDLASSAFLASATQTLELQSRILPERLHCIEDHALVKALSCWQKHAETEPPITNRGKQRQWDSFIIERKFNDLILNASSDEDKARLLSAKAPHSGDWLHTMPITSIGLRLSSEQIRCAVALRLGTRLCEPHQCPCGHSVDARGLHSLSCKKSTGRIQRHNELNDIIQRSLVRANVPAKKEPPGLNREDGKRPDGVTLIPWARGKCLVWDVTVPDTFASSHVVNTAVQVGAAATRAAALKTVKYAAISYTHLFVPLAVETGGVWNAEAIVFLNELGRRISQVTGDHRETSWLYQRLSVAIQRGNAICFAASLIEPN